MTLVLYSAIIEVPAGLIFINIILFQRTVANTLPADGWVLNFFGRGETGRFHCMTPPSAY